MDRLQLKQCLQAAGVPEDRYLLVGIDAPRAVREGAWIVRPNQRCWEVLVWEPVRSHPSVSFLSEDEACEYVLDELTSATTGNARPLRRAGRGVEKRVVGSPEGTGVPGGTTTPGRRQLEPAVRGGPAGEGAPRPVADLAASAVPQQSVRL